MRLIEKLRLKGFLPTRHSEPKKRYTALETQGGTPLLSIDLNGFNDPWSAFKAYLKMRDLNPDELPLKIEGDSLTLDLKKRKIEINFKEYVTEEKGA